MEWEYFFASFCSHLPWRHHKWNGLKGSNFDEKRSKKVLEVEEDENMLCISVHEILRIDVCTCE